MITPCRGSFCPFLIKYARKRDHPLMTKQLTTKMFPCLSHLGQAINNHTIINKINYNNPNKNTSSLCALFLLCVPHDDKITPTEKNKQYWVCHFAPCKPETCSPPDSIVTGRLNKIEQKPCRLHVAISLTAGKLDTKWSGSGPENPHGAVLGAAHIRTRWMWSMPLSLHWVAHVLNGLGLLNTMSLVKLYGVW